MGQMTLGELITTLERKDPEMDIRFMWMYMVPSCNVCSYRGYYEQLAIGYRQGYDSKNPNPKVKDLLKVLKETVGKDFQGWKGGEYTMWEDTPVWIANSGETGSMAVVDVVERSYYFLIKHEVLDG